MMIDEDLLEEIERKFECESYDKEEEVLELDELDFLDLDLDESNFLIYRARRVKPNLSKKD